MTDDKSGPVKPPVLDLKAREAEKQKAEKHKQADARENGKPEPKAGSAAANKSGPTPEQARGAEPAASPASKPTKPSGTPAKDTATPGDASTRPAAASGSGKAGPEGATTGKPPASTADPQRSSTTSLPAMALTAGAGALGGAIIVYGLALWGMLPIAEDSFDPTEIENRMAEIEGIALQAVDRSADAGDGLAGLEERIARLEAGMSEMEGQEPVSTQAVNDLEDRLGALADRVEAVAAGAGGEDADTLGSALTELRTDFQDRLASLEPRIAALETAIDDQPAIEEAQAERDRFAAIPGLLAEMETALDTGEPFSSLLGRVQDAYPELTIAPDIRTLSTSGAPQPTDIMETFETELPEILSSRPLDEEAGWLRRLADQAGAAIALRPAGDLSGDTPDALIARTERALETGDFARALDAIETFPEPMLEAAAGTRKLLADRLAARALLDQLRRQAGENGQ
ncbi:COG4223 family protein [Pelagibacterium montanilacus]|uniref:COG4223 family protein n=1 Tax=Pelagibacterium montanilacus TaxID=2185280 RepID=UPI000F8EF5E5|nr:hypothetical protein [Pelagibacterium montanilacus]